MGKIIFLIIIFILCLIIIYNRHQFNLKKKQYLAAISTVFSNIQIVQPEIKVGTAYGFPTIEVIFKTKDDYEKAKNEQLFLKYEEIIQKIHSDMKDFEANMAISYTFEKNKKEIL